MGLVNTVVPLEKVEEETIQWCNEILGEKPNGPSFLKGCNEC